MDVKLIQTTATPNQTLSFVQNGDRYAVDLLTRNGDLYASVTSENLGDIIHNRICLNGVPITNNLMFIDIDGEQDPNYSELNTRFFLIWFTV